MMRFKVKIAYIDDQLDSLKNPHYFFDRICDVALSLAEKKLQIYESGIEIFSVMFDDMSIGGRMQPYHSWAIWGSMEIAKEKVDVRVELYIPGG